MTRTAVLSKARGELQQFIGGADTKQDIRLVLRSAGGARSNVMGLVGGYAAPRVGR